MHRRPIVPSPPPTRLRSAPSPAMPQLASSLENAGAALAADLPSQPSQHCLANGVSVYSSHPGAHMKSLHLSLLLLIAIVTAPTRAADWPQWRGPHFNGACDE